MTRIKCGSCGAVSYGSLGHVCILPNASSASSADFRTVDPAWLDRAAGAALAESLRKAELWDAVVEFARRHETVPVGDAVRNVERARAKEADRG